MADGSYHPGEERIFTEISSILEIDQNRKRRVEARHLPDAWDPHMVLGVSQDASREELKHAWRRLVKKEHPDAVQARGSPKEMIRLAEERMVRINLAYAQVVRQAVPQFS
jgi:DnaJ like chaperone protein